MPKNNLREYGLPNAQEIIGTPTWEAIPDTPPCPNCGGALVVCTVRAKLDLLTTGIGTGTYMGCPCCPYASPAIYVSDKPSPHKS